jgi:ankyrin repeat protein
MPAMAFVGCYDLEASGSLHFAESAWDQPSAFGLPLGVVMLVFWAVMMLKNDNNNNTNANWHDNTKRDLHGAVYKTDVEQLISKGANVNAKDKYGSTPLHGVKNEGITKLLIDNGANVNAKDFFGETPLHIAAACAHKNVTELLIANGANVNAKNKKGETPLDDACGKSVNILRKHGGKYTLIHRAAANGDIKALKGFLSDGVDVNEKNQKGKTPLNLAKQKKHTETVDFLREHGGKMAGELRSKGK